MEYEFKVGDKVEVVKPGFGCGPKEIGIVSTITESGHYKSLPGYKVDNLENIGYDDFIGEDSFKLYSPVANEADHQHPAVALDASLAAAIKSTTTTADYQLEEQVLEAQSKFKKAPDILSAGIKHMEDRAALRDSLEGERSMKAAVAAFNALEGTNLTEVQGWRFMCVLKHARAAKGSFSIDDYEDAAAYWALAAEAAQQ